MTFGQKYLVTLNAICLAVVLFIVCMGGKAGFFFGWYALCVGLPTVLAFWPQIRAKLIGQ
ncbi:hypothetical protein [Ferrimonas marina]|uniref:Uncharacterized protein n=1 Tax=Ferrimonas marina TaxID=299255 RepID=A0A1M5S2Q5_9GAMM|nr:hypothetical protein [Ferrimonas marina]SHH32731.1 hypothetical protein SAMN02745129_1847 [Ferrimonas marina]